MASWKLPGRPRRPPEEALQRFGDLILAYSPYFALFALSSRLLRIQRIPRLLQAACANVFRYFRVQKCSNGPSDLTIVPAPTPGTLGAPYFIFTSLALPVRYTVST